MKGLDHIPQSVLRCGRCGKFVEWGEARLQIVCSCRPHLDLMPVLVRESQPADQARVVAILRRHFGHTPSVAFGAPIAIDMVSTLVAEAENEIGGVLAWRLLDDALHIVAMATEPMWQRSGIGGYLLAEAELLARRQGRERIVATIGNDNIPALYFYQRRGYRISAVRPLTADHHSAGLAGIPIVDELELSKGLPPAT